MCVKPFRCVSIRRVPGPAWAALAALLFQLAARGGDAAPAGVGAGGGWGKEAAKVERVWKGREGLPGNAVECLLESREGWLWVGTREGLGRFDGRQFKVFDQRTPGFSSDAVLALAEDAAGSLWVGTKRGLYRYEDGRFSRFGTEDGLPHAYVGGLSADAEGGLWIATQGGLARHAEGRLESVPLEWPPGTTGRSPPSPVVVSVCAAREEEVLVGTERGALGWNPRRREFGWVWRPETSLTSIGATTVRAILRGGDGAIWLGTDDAIWVGRDGEWRAMAFVETELDPRLRRLTVDLQGAVRAVRGGRVYQGTEAGLEPGERVEGWATDLLADRRGGLWIGTRYQGLVHRMPAPIQVWTARMGLPDDRIHAVVPAREGGIWVGTPTGSGRWDGGQFRELHPEGLPALPAGSLLEDPRGDLWVGHPGREARHLCRQDGVWRTTGERLVEVSRQALAADARGNVWLGGVGSLMRVGATVEDRADGRNAGPDETGWRWLYTHGKVQLRLDAGAEQWSYEAGSWRHAVEGIVASSGADAAPPGWRLDQSPVAAWEALPAEIPWVGILAARDGSLWFSTWGFGVRVLRDRRWEVISVEQGLPSPFVRWLYEDRAGAIWIGTREGLARVPSRGTSAGVGVCRRGLPHPDVHQILEDGRGSFWIGGSSGVFRVNASELGRALDRGDESLSGRLYDESDGLLASGTEGLGQLTACQDRDGDLWFATQHGLVSVTPRQIGAEAPAFSVYLDEVEVAGGGIWDVAASARPPGAVRNPEVPPGAEPWYLPAGSGRQVSFRYGAVEFHAPERMRFQHRLEGFDRQWIESGGLRQATYTNLRPGAYRFHVRARDRHGRWQEASRSIQLSVAPHFHQTPGFAVLLLGTLAAGAVRVHRLWIERIRRRERAEWMRELHDRLGGKLATLARLSSDEAPSPGSSGSNPGLRSDRVELCGLAHAALRQLRVLLSADDPGAPSLDELANQMIQLAEEAFRPVGIVLRPEVPMALPKSPVSAAIASHLLLLMGEVFGNAATHSRAANARLRLRPEQKGLWLQLADDGAGFDPQGPEAGHGRGLANLRMRARRLGARLTIDSAPGRGTVVTCFVPRLR